ncbi:SAF domain-containing protein [Paenibacillus senegalimassiliensis]|uniref:SAF domain-containing protein n=1 Tax=Paenibacillus senegalimassiliensis TaxID=1737426 RepID=UPI00073F9057|nr:SAF domain-containing protein [Paenibacillus senegalimassiliensis]
MPRLRQKTKQMLIAGLIGATAVGALFIGYALIQERGERAAKQALSQAYEEQLEDLREVARKEMAEGWVVTREIVAGHPVKQEDLKLVKLPVDSIPADVLSAEKKITGKYAKVSLQPRTLLTETLLYEEEPTPDDLRWREMSFVQLPSLLERSDVVDIRIQFPTGQDYILLSKKKVEELASGTVTLTIGETEILSLSSAIVDAYLHKASIYALAYVEPYLQKKPVPTYPSNEAVMQLIKKDPNIVKQAEAVLSANARKGLESDLLTMSPQRAAEFSSRQTQTSSYPTSSALQSGSVGAGEVTAEDSFQLDAAK